MDRLQKILASAGVASRRAAEGLIREGRVTVNGATVTVLGTRADAGRDDIRVDGRRIHVATARRYILLNKPRGVVSTRSDPQHRPTVMDLISGVKESLYPVGRLDYDSEGLLLLTNDGDLTARLTHPRHGVARTYEVQVRGVPDAHTLRRLARGVMLDDGPTAPADVRLVHPLRSRDALQATLHLTIREGRNRQARRMCETVGHPVVRLRRLSIGPVSDPQLKPGEFRHLRPDEVEALRRASAGVHPRPPAPAQTDRPTTRSDRAGEPPGRRPTRPASATRNGPAATARRPKAGGRARRG